MQRGVRAGIGFLCVLLAKSIAFAQHPAAAPAWDVKAVQAFMDAVPAAVTGGQVQPFWAGNDTLLFGDDGTVKSVSLTSGNITALPGACADADDKDTYGDALTDLCDTLAPDKSAAPPKVVRRMFPMYGYDRRETVSPDGAALATLDGPDIAFKDVKTGYEIMRSRDGAPTRRWFYGYDIWEASEDAWSDDGSKFVARLHDTSALAGIPVIDHVNAPSAVTRFRYWARAGEPLPITHFAVFDMKTQKRMDVEGGGSADTFAFFVRWLPDNKRFAVIRYSRDLKRQELLFVDSETREAQTIMVRTVKEGWVKWPSGPVGLHFLGSDQGFLWRSDEDGYFHWYHHRMDGKRIRQVTRGDFSVQGLVAQTDDTLFFMAGSDTKRPYDQHLNRVSLAGKNQRRLTQRPGQHTALPSPNARAFVIRHESLSVPPNSRVIRADGALIAKLAEATVDQEARAAWQDPEEFTAKSADGKDIVHGIIFKPHGFDPQKRYPVIERIYGGMQSQVMRRGYSTNWASDDYFKVIPYLNAQGFVVVTMDTPGTPGRGRAFNLKPHGTWPEGIIADHAAVLRQVGKQRPWMDMERVGIAGNSWGGTLAAHAMKDAPDLYKAASLSVADVDMSDGIHWIEWHLGRKADNPDGYVGKSAADLAQAMEGHFLIMAGTADANVPVSNTMKLLDGLAKAGKHYDLVLFPGTNHIHRTRDGGNRYAYAVNRMALFFHQHLGGASE
ncbi:MAG: alpha/beta fold hydrolase [Pseudomonadota bacterium]